MIQEYISMHRHTHTFDNNKNLESEILRTIIIGHQFIYFNLKLFIDFAIYKSKRIAKIRTKWIKT